MSQFQDSVYPNPISDLSGKEIRALKSADLVRLGKESLRDHLVGMAGLAHVRHAALQGDSLYAFLSDPDFVRYPVRLAFERGSMSPHQFAQPEKDPNSVSPAYLLYLHPRIRDEALFIRQAIAYYMPIINFGDMVTEDLAILYGATLMGMPENSFYTALCEIADAVGASACFSGETHRMV